MSSFGTPWNKSNIDSLEKVQSRATKVGQRGKSRLRGWTFSLEISSRGHREDRSRLFSEVYTAKGQEPTSWSKGRAGWVLGKMFPKEGG